MFVHYMILRILLLVYNGITVKTDQNENQFIAFCCLTSNEHKLLIAIIENLSVYQK